MKAKLHQLKQGFRALLGVVVVLAVCPVNAQETNAITAPVQIESVFEEPRPVLKPGYADPFFPKSTRLRPSKPIESSPAVTAPTPVISLDQLRLQGISLGAQEKTAMINNKTLGEGESATLKLPKGTVQVQVIEIRTRSVIIKLDADPEPKEIYLRPL